MFHRRRWFEVFAAINALCGVVSCLKIIGVAVPSLVDLKQQVNLTCSYDTGQESLFSVKWYKDDQEFYRYLPSVKPSVVTFPLDGATVEASPDRKLCGKSQCTVKLEELSAAASGLYTCEVSTEAPSFATMMETRNMTVAEFALGEPRIEGLRAAYTIGDMLDITCKSPPSAPPAHLTLYVNNQEIQRQDMIQMDVPDTEEATSSSARLRMVLSRRHFKTGGGSSPVLRIVCSAALDTIASPARSAAAIAVLADPQPLQTNQKLEWPHSAGVKVCPFSVMAISTIAQLLKMI